MKKLLRNVPVAIPKTETMQTTIPAFSKKALLTMEHDARLQLLDQLVPQSMWGTEKHHALLEEMQIDSVHVTKRNSIQVKFTLEHFKGTSEEMALLDTGAMESFIDHESVLCLKLGTQKLPISRPIYNVDGTKNQCGSITHVCHLLVRKGNRKETVPFYVIDLGNDCFIFRYPWCQDFKPEIDWENSILKGPKIKVETLLHGRYQHIKEYVASTRKT
jgi:hypothetical protein